MEKEISAQKIIGQVIRCLRDEKELSLEQLAGKAEITYQYLSGIENGKENFSISVLEKLSYALEVPLQKLVPLAYENNAATPIPIVDPNMFCKNVPLPPDLTVKQLEDSMNQTQFIVHRINSYLQSEVGKTLDKYIQGNNFSGLVSNIFSDALNDNSPYKHNNHQRYPDLINGSEGLEVKATINVGKGGESHNGHGGWHIIACYSLLKNGDINFIHLMIAKLVDDDWQYIGSKKNEETGSQRTETYVTTLNGKTKLRDGTIFINPNKVNFSRWKQERKTGSPPPEWSIFYQKYIKKLGNKKK